MRQSRILDHKGRPIRMYYSGPHEGATTGRRMGLWGTSVAGPNNALWSSVSTLRARSRELVRNDPQIDGALDTLASNLVGTGISPRWQLQDTELKRFIQELWADWVQEADEDELLDFYGMQSLVVRSIIESGECLLWVLPVADKNLAVPLKIKILEPDHLDETYNSVTPSGNKIRMGIEFNAKGRRVAYWLWPEHPGENFINMDTNFERIRVPAEEILHVFKPLRAGQKRGRPWLSSIILPMHDLNEFDDAELVRKKSAAMFGGFVTKSPDADDAPNPLGEEGEEDESGSPTLTLEPGTFTELNPGEDVTFSAPADVGGNYVSFVKHNERRIARGLGGLTYEKFTGDLEGVTYSSIRSGNLEFQRQSKQFIYNVLVFQMCRPIARAWITQAILSGALSIPDFAKNRRKYTRIKWTIDGWPWVDPLKDLKASSGLVRSGFSSRTQEAAERGLDVEALEDEIMGDNERADGRGLIFDSDGRYNEKTGAPKEGSAGTVSKRSPDGGPEGD